MPAAEPQCPRCGYDQSGVAATWDVAGACPLRGVCAECGAGFSWSGVLDPANRGPAWSFEHGQRVSAVRWMRTSAWTFRPSWFWRMLPRENPGRRGRLALFAGMWLAIMHAGAVLLARGWGTHMSAAGWWTWPYAAQFEVPTANPNEFYVAEFSTIAGMIWGLSALPPAFLLMIGVMPRLRVEHAGVVRGAILSSPLVAMGLLLCVGHFSAVTWLIVPRGPTPPAQSARVIYVCTLLLYPAWAWWWWRCCLAHHFGVRRASLAALALMILATAGMLQIMNIIES